MADLEIDFESEVAAKYELIPATADVISKLRENSLLREISEKSVAVLLRHYRANRKKQESASIRGKTRQRGQDTSRGACG